MNLPRNRPNPSSSKPTGPNKRARLWVSHVLLLALMVAASTSACPGCEEQNWDDPAYVAEQLESGDRFKAFEKAARLPEDKQRELVPTLVKLYKEDVDKDGSLKLLNLLRDERAKDVYVDALRNAPSNRDKGAAATALGELKAKDQISTMVQVFKDVPNEDLRRSILEAFKQMPDKSQIPLLVEILTTYDPDRESIAYHAFACEVAALMPEMTDTLVNAVVYGMFLDNNRGQNVFRQCASAVFAAGPKATPEVVSVLTGKHEKVFKRFSKFPSYVELTAEIKAADILGLLHDPAAAEPLRAELTKDRKAPASYRDEKLLAFGQNRVQLFYFSASALGDIGDEKAIEHLTPILEFDKKALAPFKDMIDYDKRAKHDVVEAALTAINKIGDRKALPALEKCIKNCDMPELKGFSPTFVGQARWEAAREYARLSTKSEAATYEKLMKAEKDEIVEEKMSEFKPMVDAAAECDGNEDCFIKLLSDKDKYKVEKAAWELGRAENRGGKAQDALLKALSTDDLKLRKIVIFGLYRVGNKDGLPALDKEIEAVDKRGGAEWKDIKFKLEALRAFMSRQ